MNIHYYLIHGIDPQRKPFMEDQFEKFGVPKDDVTWITKPNKQGPFPEGLTTDPTMINGLLSCGYKHYLALKDICEKGYDYGVIMEDNIEFRGNVPDALNRYLKDLPDDWDCLFDSNFAGLRHAGPLYSEVCVYKRDPPGTKGAHFYFITRRFAKQLYEEYLPFNHSPDHHYNILFERLRPNIYWAEPPNVSKIMRLSTWLDIPAYNIVDATLNYNIFAYPPPQPTKKLLPWIKIR